MSECAKWLQKFLQGKGWVACEVVRAAAMKKGFTKGQLRAARKELGVSTDHDNRIGHDEWYWRY